MATDPFVVRRHTDPGTMSAAIQHIKTVLNLGASSRNQSRSNVAARYQLYPLRSWATTFASLPTPGDAGVGARAVVTDVIDDEAAVGFGGAVTQGAGVNTLPVWSDGYSWLIG